MAVAAGDWQGLTPLVPRCPVPGAAAGSGPGLVKPSRTLSLTSASLVPPYQWPLGSWIHQPPGKGESGCEPSFLVATLTATHPSRAAPPSAETHPRTSSPCS